jgi:hypothetical protein
MRRDIFVFAAGAVLTALSVQYASSVLLWEIVFWGGIAAMAISCVDAILRKLSPSLVWRITLYGLTGAVITANILYFSVPHDESLPGLGAYSYVRLYDTPELRRKFIYDFVSSNGSRATFFLTKSDEFSFSVSDSNGEPYSLEIPLGNDGIPIDRYIFLFCEAGLKERSTILKVFVDDKEVASRTVPFRLNFGKLDWTIRTIGADASGQNNAPFKMAEFGLYHATFTLTQKRKLIENFKKYLADTGSSLSKTKK